MKKYSSLWKIILGNTIMTLPYLLLSLLLGFFTPFIPTIYVPSKNPGSFNNYLTGVLKTDLAFVSFILFIIIIISLIEFLKFKIKNKYSN